MNCHDVKSHPSQQAIYWLYEPLLLGFCLTQLPVFLYEYFTTDKYREDFRQRFGRYSPETRSGLRPGRSAWIHAVSVGEVVAATPVIKSLMNQHPDLPLSISTVTRTGREMVHKSLAPKSQSLFLPFDFHWITDRAIEQILPRFLLLTETEIWPNLIRSAHNRHIPVMVMNGRISSDSYRKYNLVRGLLRSTLSQIHVFGMQSQRDADRIIRLGASPKRVFVTGNLKFDQASLRIPASEQEHLAKGLHLSPETPVLIGGSIHRGEERIIIEAYRRLLTTFPDLVLLLAPRYLTEIPDIEAKCSQAGLLAERKTHLWLGERRKPSSSQFGRVIILDTIGELSKIYSLASIVFVGGSLLPIGGHNLLEPASYGKPVLFGPYLDNFREISRLLKEYGGGFEVKNEGDLTAHIENLLQDHGRRNMVGEAALRAVEENRGATQKTLALIEKFLM